MSKYNLYTAWIGVIAVWFVLSVAIGELSQVVKFCAIILGVGIFCHSVFVLYRALKGKPIYTSKKVKNIDKVTLLNNNGEDIFSWELYGKTSVIIGKDFGENHVDIDLSKNPYASMIDIEHAVLNYAEGNWFIEDLDSRNGISIQKVGQRKSYKLSSSQPCKLDFGDIILIGMCRLRVC